MFQIQNFCNIQIYFYDFHLKNGKILELKTKQSLFSYIYAKIKYFLRQKFYYVMILVVFLYMYFLNNLF